MTTLLTVLVIAAMIGACALLIQFANARHAAATRTAAHRRHSQWRGSTVRHTGHLP